MTINERLEFFKEMLRCNYDVYLWTYTPELELIHTNCPQDLVISDASSILDFADTLQECHIRKTHTDMAGFLYGSSLHFCFRIRGD